MTVVSGHIRSEQIGYSWETIATCGEENYKIVFCQRGKWSVTSDSWHRGQPGTGQCSIQLRMSRTAATRLSPVPDVGWLTDTTARWGENADYRSLVDGEMPLQPDYTAPARPRTAADWPISGPWCQWTVNQQGYSGPATCNCTEPLNVHWAARVLLLQRSTAVVRYLSPCWRCSNRSRTPKSANPQNTDAGPISNLG